MKCSVLPLFVILCASLVVADDTNHHDGQHFSPLSTSYGVGGISSQASNPIFSSPVTFSTTSSQGSSFSQPSSPSFSGSGSFNSRPSSGLFNRPVSGSFNRPVSGSFNRPVSGSFNRPVSGSFNRPSSAFDSSFVQPSTGTVSGGTLSGTSGSFLIPSVSSSASNNPPIAIISEVNNPPGTTLGNSDFNYAFEAENGIKQQASGTTVQIGENRVVVMRGSYEYIGDDGLKYVVDWYADETGFHPSGPHLPNNLPSGTTSFTSIPNTQDSFNGGFQEGSSSFTNGGFTAGSSTVFSASNPTTFNAPVSNYGI